MEAKHVDQQRRHLLHTMVFRNRQSRLWPPKNAVRRGITLGSDTNGVNWYKNQDIIAIPVLLESSHNAGNDKFLPHEEPNENGNTNQNNNNVSGKNCLLRLLPGLIMSC